MPSIPLRELWWLCHGWGSDPVLPVVWFHSRLPWGMQLSLEWGPSAQITAEYFWGRWGEDKIKVRPRRRCDSWEVLQP